MKPVFPGVSRDAAAKGVRGSSGRAGKAVQSGALLLVSALLLLFFAGLLHAQVALPPLKTALTDLTGTLSAQQAADLDARLKTWSQQKGSQIAVLILPSTQPEAIEQYAIRLAEAWKIGRKGTDDGIIMVVAKDDRAVRIEVGYGLEGAIPDAIAKRIVEERVIPRFRQGDFYGGISEGVTSIMKLVEGEQLPPPARQGTGRTGSAFDLQLLMFLLVLLTVINAVLGRLVGRFAGSAIGSAGVGFIIWLIVGSLIGAIVVALIGFALSIFSGASRGFPQGGRLSRGGWPTGGWGGGGFGGGGLGGGGFGGGGGGFGGGGASGRW